MDDFLSIETGSGLLKDDYDLSPLQKALKKKRDKMKMTLEDKAGVEPEEDEWTLLSR